MFEPLLLEEAGAQVLRGIEEGCVIEPHPAVVAACSKVRRLGWWFYQLSLQGRSYDSIESCSYQSSAVPLPQRCQQQALLFDTAAASALQCSRGLGTCMCLMLSCCLLLPALLSGW